MVKGFEHLSDAQLEHYGTENFAVISDDAQRIEAHLEECADCRSRVLEHQRARFGFMADSMNASPPATACVPEDDLRDFAAGITTAESDGDKAKSQAKVLAITQHLAQCPLCARILRTLTEDFSEDLTPEEIKAEKEFQAQLKSASPTWQRDIVSQAMKANRASDENLASDANRASAFGQQKKTLLSVEAASTATNDLRSQDAASAGVPLGGSAIRPSPTGRRDRTGGWFPRWILAPAALAACAAIAFAVWFTQRDTPEKVEKLLAQAYTEQRTMEMRIPYAEHSDFKQTRSGESTSLLNSPAALRKAADQIASNLKKNPDDPKWLLASARFDLMEGHYGLALATLDKIDSSSVTKTPDYLVSRSIAFYLKAESEPQSQQAYGEAVDLLGKVLQQNPNDPVALFNQALACEKIPAMECALSDWQRLIKIEDGSGWAAEAHEHQKRIQEKKTLDH